MGIYPGIPSIRTRIRTDGPVPMTEVWRDDRIIRVVPTHKSQIRHKEDYLWHPEADIKTEGKEFSTW